MEKLRELVKKYLFAALAFVLAIALGTVLFNLGKKSEWRSPVEALFIASVLTVFVDPYLKKKLFLEASRDIFHLMLGFSLPKSIQLRLRKYLSDIEYYRESMEMWACFIRADDGLRLQLKIEADIVLVQDCEYRQIVSFEESDRGRLEHMDAKYATDGVSIYRGQSMRLPDAMQDPPMTHVYSYPKIHIEADQKITSEFTFSIAAAEQNHWNYVFGSTTAKSIVHLDPGPDMEIFISSPFSQDKDQHYYTCNEVITVNERFTIRWRPKKPDPLSVR